MSFQAHILTLYPKMFPGPLGESLIGRALQQNKWQLNVINIRDFATDKHASVDNSPAGGGAGMILRADILAKAIDSVKSNCQKILLTPSGVPFTQSQAKQFAKQKNLMLICGRFEGVDERIIKARNLSPISIGDYILSGGEIAAMAMLDSIIRLIPNVLGNPTSTQEESFTNGLLEYPQYTAPDIWQNMKIPPVLKSGNHEKIKQWRQQQAIALTKSRRPDLLKK